jgi:tetratricopeptide (TPR) repeat protein
MSFLGFKRVKDGLVQWASRPGRASRLLAATVVAAGMSYGTAIVHAKLTEGQLAIFGLDPKFSGKGSDDLEKAINALQEGNGDRALELLDVARDKNKSLPPARVMLARMLFATNRQELIPAAKQQLEKAATDNPESPDVHLLLGNLAVTEGRLSDAELQFLKAMSLAPATFSPNPKDPAFDRFKRQVYAGLTMVSESRQDWPKSKSSASLWLEASSEDKTQQAMAEQHLGRAAFYAKDREGAKDHFEKAYSYDPKVEYPLISLGLLAAQANDDDEKPTAEDYMKMAQRDVESGKVKDPKTVAAIHQAVSQWLLVNNKPDEAAKEAMAAMQADKDSDALKRLIGVLALYQKNWTEAERIFSEMYTKSPADFFASNNLALALIEAPGDSADAKAKHDRAVGIAEVNVRSFPKSADAISTLGWIYYKQKRLDEAEQALKTAVQGAQGQATPSTAYYLANVFVARNQLDNAVKVLQQALQFNGPFPYRVEAEQMLKRFRPDIDLDSLRPKATHVSDTSTNTEEATPPAKAPSKPPKKQ